MMVFSLKCFLLGGQKSCLTGAGLRPPKSSETETALKPLYYTDFHLKLCTSRSVLYPRRVKDYSEYSYENNTARGIF